jgi:hypothetical protein
MRHPLKSALDARTHFTRSCLPSQPATPAHPARSVRSILVSRLPSTNAFPHRLLLSKSHSQFVSADAEMSGHSGAEKAVPLGVKLASHENAAILSPSSRRSCQLIFGVIYPRRILSKPRPQIASSDRDRLNGKVASTISTPDARGRDCNAVAWCAGAGGGAEICIASCCDMTSQENPSLSSSCSSRHPAAWHSYQANVST